MNYNRWRKHYYNNSTIHIRPTLNPFWLVLTDSAIEGTGTARESGCIFLVDTQTLLCSYIHSWSRKSKRSVNSPLAGELLSSITGYNFLEHFDLQKIFTNTPVHKAYTFVDNQGICTHLSKEYSTPPQKGLIAKSYAYLRSIMLCHHPSWELHWVPRFNNITDVGTKSCPSTSAYRLYTMLLQGQAAQVTTSIGNILTQGREPHILSIKCKLD